MTSSPPEPEAGAEPEGGRRTDPTPDPVPGREPDGDWRWDDSRSGRSTGSWSEGGEKHWTHLRAGKNEEAIEYYRRRSQAPGVAEGGGVRAQYCLECEGVLPLAYDQRRPAATAPQETCPHCGAPVDPRVRRMFNWVEIDQPPPSDLPVLFLWLAILVAVLGTIVVAALFVG